MQPFDLNPFPNDRDRAEIWDILMTQDIDAYIAGDWSRIDANFARDEFMGLNAHGSVETDVWRLGFPSVQSYRDEWERQSAITAQTRYAESIRDATFRVSHLHSIQIANGRAVAHKKLSGTIARLDADPEILSWQTLYYCAQREGRWKITGFLGYLPFPLPHL